MPGLVPASTCPPKKKRTWMAGTSPAMTTAGDIVRAKTLPRSMNARAVVLQFGQECEGGSCHEALRLFPILGGVSGADCAQPEESRLRAGLDPSAQERAVDAGIPEAQSAGAGTGARRRRASGSEPVVGHHLGSGLETD